MDLSLNPMTAVISGWRWAVLDGTAPVLGQVALSVGVAARPVRGRPRRLPLVRAAVRGHDLMAVAIDAQGLSQAVPDRRAPGRVRDAPGVDRPRRRSGSPASEHVAAAQEIWALDDVSFEVEEGEVLGIIGRNGAGKSTLLKVLSRITTPTQGRAEIRGRVGSLLEVGTGFHPELTGRENIYLNGAILGMKRREIAAAASTRSSSSPGVERFLDTPVKRYSSGMYVRLAFSVAAHLEPEILLVDEVLAVGDAEFQRALPRADGGSRRRRAHGALRVAQHAGDRQLCDRALLHGERPDRARRAERRSRRPLPADGGRRGSSRTSDDLDSAPGDDVSKTPLVPVEGKNALSTSSPGADPSSGQMRFEPEPRPDCR